MMNPPSITVVHSIHQYVLFDKGLTKVLLIKASSTWAQNFNILTEFSLNKAHKLFDTINLFSGKHYPMHPTSIHLIKQCRKALMNNSTPIQSYTFNSIESRKKSQYLDCISRGRAGQPICLSNGPTGELGHGGVPVPHQCLRGCMTSSIWSRRVGGKEGEGAVEQLRPRLDL
jgi:hypothetical protein